MAGVSAIRSAPEPFIFGVPLIARACAADWDRVGDLLALTLRSVLAQTDPDFTLLLAGHDAPESWSRLTRSDPRFRYLEAHWDPEMPSVRNNDGGCKKWMIRQHVLERGGGLLMYLDADDLVDRRLVETARSTLGGGQVAAVIDRGIILDLPSLRAVPLPDPRVYDGGFHELCGSSTVARVEPGSPEPLRRDPHAVLGSHHRWPEAARKAGAPLVRLPVRGAYLVNTAVNHSERHGPFADWRRQLNRAVARQGAALDGEAAARFGVELEHLEAARAGR